MHPLRAPIGVGLALLALAGCAPYVSAYRAPLDGRARAVWDAHGEMIVEPSGLVLTPECAAAIRALTGRDRMPLASGTVELPVYAAAGPTPVGGVWQPIYYGAPIGAYGGSVVVHQPVFFWIPGLYWHESIQTRGYGTIHGGSMGRALTAAASGGGGGGGSGRGGSGGGGGGDSGKAAVIAAVVAAIALPIVDVSIAAATPISETRAALVTDVVGAWNDLARTPGSPCTMPGGAVPLPAEMTTNPTAGGTTP